MTSTDGPGSGLPLEPHHVFGRGHLPGIPSRYCDSEELILGICGDWPPTGYQGCHSRIHGDGDKALMAQARGLALVLFAKRYRLEAELIASLDMDALDTMRVLARTLADRDSSEKETT